MGLVGLVDLVGSVGLVGLMNLLCFMGLNGMGCQVGLYDPKGISIGSMDFDNPKVYGDTSSIVLFSLGTRKPHR